jgi:hypothetical protein
MITPPLPAGAKEQAQTADFHVVCSDRRCEHHFVVNREFGFAAFPLRCPRCDQVTGLRARPCNRQTCGGRWVVPIKEKDGLYCPICDQRFE